MNKDSHLIFEAYIANLREGTVDISKYKNIIDKLSRGEFDTESQKELVDEGVKEGIFDVEVVNGKRQVVLTNEAIKQIEEQYPELKDKFWECGKCKADYPGCGEAKREKSEEEEMPYPEFAKLSKHAASKLPEDNPIEQEDDDSTALVVRGTVHSLGNGYSVLVTKEREEDRYSYDIDILKDVDPKNSKYTYITQIHRLGEIGNSIKNWADSKEPLLRQKAIDALKKYGADIPDLKHEDEERRLDPKCWRGYHKAGTKLKGGVRVNKCVKNS